MNIGSKDIVLEIGSGGDPHLGPDILCGKYLGNND